MPYNDHLVYKPGKDEKNPADFLSRHPNCSEPQPARVAEEYVNYVCTNAVPTAMTLQEIQLETSADNTMQMVIQAIETNNWLNPATSEYKKVSDELSVHKGIILCGHRIVMPTSLNAGKLTSQILVIKESLKPNVYCVRKSGFLISTRWSKKPFGPAFPARLPLRATTLHLSYLR